MGALTDEEQAQAVLDGLQRHQCAQGIVSYACQICVDQYVKSLAETMAKRLDEETLKIFRAKEQ